jgi:BirA family biotin operon repressor/biotin-[acetyl-CoA-carboxylase] ligase
VLSEKALVQALERNGIAAPVRYEDATPSTQALAEEMASAGAPEWTLVAAGHQTEGRGRLGRSWADEPGTALLFSLVLRPDLEPRLGGLLTLLAGTALVRACGRASGQRAACKWPNDLLIDGRKAGGILAGSSITEDRFEHVVLGIGVNLTAPPPGFDDAGAVHAEDSALLEGVLGELARVYRPGLSRAAADIVTDYRAVCATLGTRVRATTTDGITVEGVAEDVDELGGLVIQTRSGLEVVRFGEVRHLE